MVRCSPIEGSNKNPGTIEGSKQFWKMDGPSGDDSNHFLFEKDLGNHHPIETAIKKGLLRKLLLLISKKFDNKIKPKNLQDIVHYWEFASIFTTLDLPTHPLCLGPFHHQDDLTLPTFLTREPRKKSSFMTGCWVTGWIQSHTLHKTYDKLTNLNILHRKLKAHFSQHLHS